MKKGFLHIPPFVRTTLAFFLGVWGLLLLARLASLILVATVGVNGATQWDALFGSGLTDTLTALYIGAKFDARIAVFLTIPLGLCLFIPWLENRPTGTRVCLDAVYVLLTALTALVYIVDFGYFFYLRQRVDATLWDFLRDAAISYDMVIQSYPVVWIALGLLAFTLASIWLFDRLLRRHARLVKADSLRSENLWRLHGTNWKSRAGWGFALFVCLFLMAYGQISSNFFPLRWSNAYFSVNKDMVLLALNPIQNLYDTVHSMQVVKPDENAVRTAYDDMAAWLRVDQPDKDKLNFWRTVKTTTPEQPWNIVVIVMESLSWPMTSFAPGDDDPTPVVRRLASEGLYFSNFYAPARTTARAIFTFMTGIPDVNREGGTTSRNPVLVNQFLPISEFDGYKKLYMIGGSASWANIRGVLTHNVPDLQLMEESSWKAPNVDVWGISDLALFRESVEVFNTVHQPFIAVVQTAGFHRPYTIPDDNAGFKVLQGSPELLRNYGYASNEEYNSLRFSDHALGEFFRLAKQQPWFSHTIFAIFGDHGLYNTSENVSAGYLTCRLQGSHVPLILYAPGLIEPGTKTFPCGQPDVFPTLAALAGVPMRHHGLGRNLLDPGVEQDARQFIAGDSELFRRLIKDGYCYIREATEGLYKLDDLSGKNLIDDEPLRASEMRREAEEAYQVSKYLLFHNSRPDEDQN
ncbi:MAG TPA: sulfatase-like hydrolase/transferase [Candidatus Avidesulfovibrio excrementigallinarum]|nr:sulfatase-like hydrolase/transferase [Candidatus Avidesulfovibrio excrementigallinarum]